MCKQDPHSFHADLGVSVFLNVDPDPDPAVYLKLDNKLIFCAIERLFFLLIFIEIIPTVLIRTLKYCSLAKLK